MYISLNSFKELIYFGGGFTIARIGNYIANYQLKIYNQWGQLTYSGDKPWDGKSSGTYVPEGTYFYVFEGKGVNGDDVKREGHITLLR